jgi:CheY-like chemotaxis protein
MAKLLLVEDSPTQAVEIRMLLEEGSHDVMHVANGQLAMEVLDQEPIELVVTDLEMPVMNGLELVEAMKVDFEHIPAILVTARGSEELASKALQKGAAGYVPKNHLQALLNDTITDVLGVIRTDASFAKLIKMLRKNVFVFDLPNDAELISPMVALLMQVIAGMELIGGTELVRMGVALEHALVNAMYRGNLEVGPSVTPPHRAIVYDDATTDLIEKRKSTAPYKDRIVHVDASASKEEIRILVRDEGKGFNTADLPGPGDPKVLDTESGRGLVLMVSFTDELIFNDTGNEVTLVKRCRKV